MLDFLLPGFWDKETKKPKSKRRCIGLLDPETGTVQPNEMRGGNRKTPAEKPEKKRPNVSLIVAAYLPFWIRCVWIQDSAIY